MTLALHGVGVVDGGHERYSNSDTQSYMVLPDVHDRRETNSVGGEGQRAAERRRWR